MMGFEIAPPWPEIAGRVADDGCEIVCVQHTERGRLRAHALHAFDPQGMRRVRESIDICAHVIPPWRYLAPTSSWSELLTVLPMPSSAPWIFFRAPCSITSPVNAGIPTLFDEVRSSRPHASANCR